ncbi:hypothetical protein NON00_09795 [Roseomonas sp. GC11]|uniref:hypothetical protein n=1 Tax=Roseomonas sp. GC11 TaxID=2950546 RepID=UPI00210CC973|nr:hypothetical protein [Roseomonas sp. GC11]MCQ4160219.1 hypothetical protein [Roseomonas sp. GC11]
MSLTSLQAVQASAESLRSTLAVAQALVHSGRQIDMAGLEREVAVLCAAALALPRACRGEARQALRAVQAGLEMLLTTLPGRQES